MQPTNSPTQQTIPLFYHNQMHSNYTIDERVLKSIVMNKIKCTQDNTKIKLIIYYRNKKTCNLVMKNNCLPSTPESDKSHVCYKFICPIQDCRPEEYIGYTEVKLSNRLKNHTYNGSIKQHFITQDNSLPSKQQLIDNTKIIAQADTKYKLLIKEALLIQKHNPAINKQFDSFPNILKLHIYRRPGINQLTSPHTTVNTLSNHSNSITTTQPSSNNTSNNFIVNPVSPNISQRINTLIASSRNNNDINPHRTMVLRSQRNTISRT